MRVEQRPSRRLTYECPSFERQTPLIDRNGLRKIEFDGLLFWLILKESTLEQVYVHAAAQFEKRAFLVESVTITETPSEVVPDMYGFSPWKFFRIYKRYPKSAGYAWEVREKQGKIILYEDHETQRPSLLVCVPRFMDARTLMEGVFEELLAIRPFSSIPHY